MSGLPSGRQHLLVERLGDALGQPAVPLTGNQQGIDDAPAVVHREVLAGVTRPVSVSTSTTDTWRRTGRWRRPGGVEPGAQLRPVRRRPARRPPGPSSAWSTVPGHADSPDSVSSMSSAAASNSSAARRRARSITPRGAADGAAAHLQRA